MDRVPVRGIEVDPLQGEAECKNQTVQVLQPPVRDGDPFADAGTPQRLPGQDHFQEFALVANLLLLIECRNNN